MELHKFSIPKQGGGGEIFLSDVNCIRAITPIENCCFSSHAILRDLKIVCVINQDHYYRAGVIDCTKCINL